MIIKIKTDIDQLLASIAQKSLDNKIYLDINKHILEQHKTKVGPLKNILYDLKLNFLTTKYKTDAASLALKKFTSIIDCEIYITMEKYGAIMIGKTNCDEFACGSLGTNSIYGPIFYDNCYTGGSSSGSAYAAKFFSDISFGTDTGGSCRLPAMFVRLYAYKPSLGAISRYGVIEYSKSMDTVSCIFKDPSIALQVYKYIVYYDEKDSLSYHINKYTHRNYIGLLAYKQYYNNNEQKILQKLLSLFHYEETNITFDLNMIKTVYSVITSQDIFSECYKYDDLRYSEQDTLDTDVYKKRYDNFKQHIKNKFVFGAMLAGDKQLRKYQAQAIAKRSNIIRIMNKLLHNKFLILPSLFPNIDNTESLLQIANLAGLPSVSIPINDNDTYENKNIPLKYSGIIIIGDYGSDYYLLNILKKYYEM